MIRDTSAQDKVLSELPGQARKRWAWRIGGVVIVAAAALTLLSAWHGPGHSVNASRLHIETVTRGTLVRDALVNGRVVAAVSPTLFATSNGLVTLKVNAGDAVTKGDVVAVVESPDLADELKRAQSSYEQLQAEVAHQAILAKKQKLAARSEADQAEIEQISA